MITAMVPEKENKPMSFDEFLDTLFGPPKEEEKRGAEEKPEPPKKQADQLGFDRWLEDELKKAQFKRPEPKTEDPVIKSKPDPVNHPEHYTSGGIETIDFIEAKCLGFCLGNVVKYVTRAGKKDDKLQDLKKARWYLNREIEALECHD